MPSAERNKTQLREQGFYDRVGNPDREVLNGLGEIAAYLDWSITIVRKAIKRGGLPASFSGKRYLCTKTLINQWIACGHLKRCQDFKWVE